MKFDTISTTWANLSRDSSIVIVTEAGRRALAEKIKADNTPLVGDVQILDIAAGEFREPVTRLRENDLLLVMLTTEGYMGKNYRKYFSPFQKPSAFKLKGKYIFIRLDIPEEALLSGLNTDIRGVEKTVAGLSALQKDAVVRITAENGTNCAVRVKRQNILPYHAREPGGHAFLPPSEVSEDLYSDSANGRVVADVTVGEFRVNGKLIDKLGIVDLPVTVTFENGLVREVSGGRMAGRLRECFSRLPDIHHFAVELGHGLSDLEPTGIIGVDESMAGTCHIGIGDRSLYHLDIVIRAPSFTLL